MVAIGQTLEEFESRKESNREYTVFSDSQAAISRILSRPALRRLRG